MRLIASMVIGCVALGGCGESGEMPATQDGGIDPDGGGAPDAPDDPRGDNDTGFVDCPPGGGPTYNPSSAADVADVARIGATAVITSSFDCDGCTFAEGQTIVPSGGIISGADIDLNGACIQHAFAQLFADTAKLTSPYASSRLSPETFGATSGDANDDTAAIDALINNAEYATATTNGAYVKNSPSRYTRPGGFDWHMHGAVVRTTSNANFRINTFDVDYIFEMTNLAPRIYEGEFDGSDVYGRLFWLKGQPSWYFADLNVHDYHSTSNARAIAFRMALYPERHEFSEGGFFRNTIDNIIADTDGVANNVNGLSKGVLLSLYEDGTANVYFEGNTITNIIGDDAECVYAAPQGSATMTNDVHFYFKNETYKYAKRRQVKMTVSNVHFDSCWFEAPGVAQDFPGQAATIVGIFSTKTGQTNKNFEMRNCDLVQTGTHVMHGLSLTEIEDAVVEGNRFTWSDVSNYAGISFGSGTAGYSGVFINNSFRQNTFTNCGVQIASIFDPQEGPLTIDGNSFAYDWNGNNPGNYVGVLRYAAYGSPTVSEPVVFSNNSITYNASSSFSLFKGVFLSFTATVQNLTLDNVDVTYTGTPPGEVFGYVGTTSAASFDATNVIKNCTISGASGTGSITVTGATAEPTITNSVGDGATAITVE